MNQWVGSREDARRLTCTTTLKRETRWLYEADGFRLYASDYPPSLPRGGFQIDREILQSQLSMLSHTF